MAKYGAHPRCPGCRSVLGEVATQCGHDKECKSRIMTAMEADKDDKHTVRRWYLAKGIDEESKPEEQKTDEQAGTKEGTDEPSGTPSMRKFIKSCTSSSRHQDGDAGQR